MASAEHKDFGTPDEVRNFEKARVELVNIGGGQVGRLTVEPGWRWSTHMKEVAGTELCEAPHFQYVLEGTVHVVMADGTELDIGPGQVALLPPGHDAWVVGDEPVVTVDWAGASRWGGGA
ncbi:MAG TPA: cupin domain-containing protein [Miltoncostaeaceae bacterium]|jgi:mannose-6-phosphate isomerase-like protein (cupin superfamily)|nr:cupin domain-containing protein [Miltoncostaeaceae bacterium]